MKYICYPVELPVHKAVLLLFARAHIYNVNITKNGGKTNFKFFKYSELDCFGFYIDKL